MGFITYNECDCGWTVEITYERVMLLVTTLIAALLLWTQRRALTETQLHNRRTGKLNLFSHVILLKIK